MENSEKGESDWGTGPAGGTVGGTFPGDCEKIVVIRRGVCDTAVGLGSPDVDFSDLTVVETGFVVLAPGFLVGSKLMIRILGIHPSVESNPTVLADLFFPGTGDVGDAGDKPIATRDAG